MFMKCIKSGELIQIPESMKMGLEVAAWYCPTCNDNEIGLFDLKVKGAESL